MKPHKYQLDALGFMLEHPRSYCALDMGLGKTLIALKWCEHILEETNGVLIVAPLRTIYSSWPEEIAKWTPALSYTVLHGTSKQDRLSDDVDLYMINYEGLPWLYDQLKRMFKITGRVPFRGVVFDEGSMLKSGTTKRFKTLKKLCTLFPKWRTILSGTPAPNSLMDLWSQYFILDEGQRLSPFITHFKRKYFYQVDRQGFIWSLNVGADQQIYKAIEDITYRLASEGIIDLPPRIDNVIKLELPKATKKRYDKLQNDFFIELEDESKLTAMNAAAKAMKLRQFIQGGVYTDDGLEVLKERPYEVIHKVKLNALKDLVDAAAGQGIICAIQFKFELNMIKKVYPKAPVIAGGIKPAESTRILAKWNKGEIPLLLCHPKSLSHGLNLQSGSHLVLWYGLTWSLEQYLQLNKRLHRQGQLNTVIIHHFIMKGTLDEAIMTALKRKFKGQNELLDYLREAHK